MNKIQYSLDSNFDADLMRYFDYEVSDSNSITACNKRERNIKRKDKDDDNETNPFLSSEDITVIVNFLILALIVGTLCYFLSEIGV